MNKENLKRGQELSEKIEKLEQRILQLEKKMNAEKSK